MYLANIYFHLHVIGNFLYFVFGRMSERDIYPLCHFDEQTIITSKKIRCILKNSSNVHSIKHENWNFFGTKIDFNLLIFFFVYYCPWFAQNTNKSQLCVA